MSATATPTATDRDAIARIMELYIEGAATGDISKLQEAFHKDARMFGAVGDDRYDIPIEQFFQLAAEKPLKTDDAFKAQVTSITQVGDAAAAVVEEEGAWGGVSFTDFFNLARIDGEWKITNKTFAHTGGAPAQ
jgi:hypothetical protein